MQNGIFIICLVFIIAIKPLDGYVGRKSVDMCKLLPLDLHSNFKELDKNDFQAGGILSGCKQDFQVKISENLIGKRIQFDLIMKNFPPKKYFDPLLVAEYDKIPKIEISQDTELIHHYSFKDLIGYNTRQLERSLVIKIAEHHAYLYVTFFKDLFFHPEEFDDTMIEYEFTFRVIEDDVCPYACKNEGICSKGRCVCKKNFFEEDCSIFPQIFNPDADFVLRIKPRTYEYYAIQIFDSKTFTQIFSSQSRMSNIFQFIKIQSQQNYEIPSSIFFDCNSEIKEGNTIFRIENQENYVSYILVALWNDNDEDQEIKFSIRKKVAESIVDIFIFFIKIFSIVMIILYSGMAWIHGINPLSTTSRSNLNSQNIENFFPEKEFQYEFAQYEQKSCSICLIDYEPKSMCRKLLPCQHIFHSHCIESWLSSKKKCPLCNGTIKWENSFSQKNLTQELLLLNRAESSGELRDIEIEVNPLVSRDSE